jgi:hypothetical protein
MLWYMRLGNADLMQANSGEVQNFVGSHTSKGVNTEDPDGTAPL